MMSNPLLVTVNPEGMVVALLLGEVREELGVVGNTDKPEGRAGLERLSTVSSAGG